MSKEGKAALAEVDAWLDLLETALAVGGPEQMPAVHRGL